jgi:hypothetical protein
VIFELWQDANINITNATTTYLAGSGSFKRSKKNKEQEDKSFFHKIYLFVIESAKNLNRKP